ncbi:MAG: dockerin type I repeat-containing protein [Prevotella sp.]|nr:dockerin type I repeat-containing protein [Prevotella sp.]MBP5506507.1 dockerin type I repeat-containing protein [Prevotella sp.]
MRKFILLLTVILPVMAWGQTTNNISVSAKAEDIFAGGSSSLVISLTNEGDDKYNGFQFDLFLPGEITLTTDEKDRFTYTFSDRFSSSGMTASIRDLGEGWYRVMGYSLENILITGNEGPLMTLTLKAPEEWGAEDELKGKLSEVVLSRVDGSAIDCEPSEFNINKTQTMMGDVNFSKTVDVTDVMLVVSYILGDIYPDFYIKYADMDKNGIVDITDGMRIVDIILHKE